MDFNSKKKLPVLVLCILIGNTPQVFSSATSLKGDVGVELVMQQQKGIVTGVVTDANGETIIGANVVVKGTITDIDGKFSLSEQNKKLIL